MAGPVNGGAVVPLTFARWSGISRLIAAVAVLALSVPVVAAGQQQKPLPVSMLQLIATPERYDGKQVSVVGFLVFGFEGDWLYLHKEDRDNDILANCIRVDRTKQMSRDLEKLDRNYVQIVGRFRQEVISSGFASQGHIVNVEKCELWSQPNHPRDQRLREMQGERPKENQ